MFEFTVNRLSLSLCIKTSNVSIHENTTRGREDWWFCYCFSYINMIRQVDHPPPPAQLQCTTGTRTAGWLAFEKDQTLFIYV